MDFISRRPGAANSAAIIKIAIMLIKTTCKDSVKVKRIRINVSNVSPDITKIAYFW